MKCKIKFPKFEPVKFLNKKYNYVKSRYMETTHQAGNKEDSSINFTTSIPTFLQYEKGKKKSCEGKQIKPFSSKDEKEINIVLNKRMYSKKVLKKSLIEVQHNQNLLCKI